MLIFVKTILAVNLIAFLSTTQANLPKKDQVLYTENLKQAYLMAIKDAEIAEPEEIYRDLTAIVEYNRNLVWKGEPGHSPVLMVTWTSWKKYLDKIGQEMVAERDIWVTAVPEIKIFLLRHPAQNLSLRLEQLLGLPPGSGKTMFVELWVNSEDLFRPSPDPEITDHEAGLEFPRSERFLTVRKKHKNWFNCLKKKSYDKNGFPWTRLGYTYDWGNPDSEVGLSEFVIKKGATIEIHRVYSTEDYSKQSAVMKNTPENWKNFIFFMFQYRLYLL